MNNKELAKEIVVAALNNSYIYKAGNNQDTAKEVAEFFKIIYKAVDNPN